MRKLILNIILLLAMGAVAQETLTVYDGTTTNGYVPVYGFYCDAYLKSEFVIPSSDLVVMSGKTISEMKFYASQSSVSWGNANFQVFLKEVDDATISVYSGTEGATVVYEGALSISDGEMVVPFVNNYVYNGGNLLVGVYNTTKGSYVTSTWYGQQVDGASVQGHSYDNLSDISANQRDFIPKTTFTYEGSCTKPTELAVSNVGYTSATLSWTAGGEETAWVLKYGLSGFNVATEGTSVELTEPTYSLTGLADNTSYDVYVKAVCGEGDESRWVMTTFRTSSCLITTFPWSENFDSYDIGDFNAPCWVNEHISGYGTYVFRIITTSSSVNSTHKLQLPDMSSGTRTKLVLPEMYFGGVFHKFVLDLYRSNNTYNVSSNPYEGIRIFASVDGEIDGATELAFIPRQYNEANGAIPAEAATGWYTYEFNIPITDTCYIILQGESMYCTSTVMDNFMVTNAGLCNNPTNLNVSNVTDRTAVVSWTPGADETSWQICINDDENNLIDVNTNQYVLSGLDGATIYSVKVRANCGGSNGISEWSDAVSFETYEDLCKIRFELTDRWGDSWNDAAISITNVATGEVLGTVTNQNLNGTSGSGENEVNIVYFPVQSGMELAFSWVSGSYDSECSYVVYGTNEEEIFSGSGTMSSAVTYIVSCSYCRVPADLQASDVSENTATISWTGNNESYEIRYRREISEPQQVIFSEGFENGIPDGWTNIDADGDGYTWTVTAAFSGHSGNKCISSGSYDFSAGALSPDNWLITPAVVLPQGVENINLKFYANAQDSEVAEDHYGVYISTTTVDTAAFTLLWEENMTAEGGSHRGVPGAWGEKNTDLTAYAGRTVYIAIRHFNCYDMFFLDIDEFSINVEYNSVWTVLTATDTLVDLAELTPGATYEYQVNGICGNINDNWSEINTFTTVAECPQPSNLNVVTTVNSASITWTGASDSYVLRYRDSRTQTLLSESFENGISDEWTVVDADGDGFTWGLSSELMSGYVAHSGSDMLSSQSFDFTTGTLTPDNWLITPAVALPENAESINFRFYVNVQDVAYPSEHYGVYISTTTTDLDAFSLLWEEDLNAAGGTHRTQGAWGEKNTDLTAYAGQTVYVAIRHFNSSNMFYFNLDDIAVVATIETLDWTEVTSATSPFELTGLPSNTTYYYQINGVCGGNDDNWTAVNTFTTLPFGYTITATAGDGGTITPSGNVTVYETTSQSFTITANAEYRLASVMVDGAEAIDQLVDGVYTFTNVNANHTIAATFEAIPTYTITIRKESQGSVTYNGTELQDNETVTVQEGATPSFEIVGYTTTNGDRFIIGTLTIDEEEVDVSGESPENQSFTYTFEPVNANHTLAVTFVFISSVNMSEAGSMVVYPNPNNGTFSIDFSNFEGEATYQLIDARGAVVETQDINVMNGATMNFNHNLRAGTYFVRIISGDKVYVGQIVVE